MLIRRPGIYRHAGRLGYYAAPLGENYGGVFTALDADGRFFVDTLNYEPERVALQWSDVLARLHPEPALNNDFLANDLDRFYDYVVEYTVTHAEQLSRMFPRWVRLNEDNDEVTVVWSQANAFSVLQMFHSWAKTKPASFHSFEACRFVYQQLTPVELDADNLAEACRILQRKPTHFEHVLYAQAALAFVNETLKQIRQTEVRTVQ